MMCFGKVSVTSCSTFNKAQHLQREDVIFGTDLDGRNYARLNLPSAKMAKPGMTQSVFLSTQGELCPITAIMNLAKIVPARADDPLFSWRDNRGEVRLMVKARALDHINSILSANGWGNAFSHSFRIGGVLYYLAQKVSPEIVRIAGRWKSLAYEAYIRAFEQVTLRHMGSMPSDTAAYSRLSIKSSPQL
jgi:hypothetical protein